MSFDVNNFINNFMNKIGKTGGVSGNENTKEAEKNMQAGQQQYLNYVETPDDEPAINRKEILNNYKYGIPDADLILHDEVEDNGKTPEQSVKKYGIPDAEIHTDYGIVLKPTPTEIQVLKYGVPAPEPTPTAEVSTYYGIQVNPTPSPEDPLPTAQMDYGIQVKPDPTMIVSMYAHPMPTPEPTEIPMMAYGIQVPMYALPNPEIEPTPIVTPEPQPMPQPMPQPQPMPIRPSNPWRINVRNIFLNMFGGENSFFAQRVMNVFDNFFSRWR